MSKAGSVAIELRRLADALDKQPDAEIIKPMVTFYGYEKSSFIATVKLLPRPLKKRISEPGDSKWARVRVGYVGDAIDIDASVPQSLTCELVQPAKAAVYRCDPIFSEEEDAALEVTA